MVVSSKNSNTRSTLPIPYSDSLIIRSRDDPGVFPMEEDSPNIIEICANEISIHLLLI
jgi:hypothetical protein